MPPARQIAQHDGRQIERPVCPTCAVPMWLTKILSQTSGGRLTEQYYFECKVCNSVEILPSLDSSRL